MSFACSLGLPVRNRLVPARQLCWYLAYTHDWEGRIFAVPFKSADDWKGVGVMVRIFEARAGSV
jgi:hypothetical protein